MIIDAERIKHVTVTNRCIDAMSGFIDPKTHLNLDYPYHKVDTCIIADEFKIGAKIRYNTNTFVLAHVDYAAYAHYGHVDYTQRLLDMINAVKAKKVQV